MLEARYLGASATEELASRARKRDARKVALIIANWVALTGECAVYLFEKYTLFLKSGECPVLSIPVGWGTGFEPRLAESEFSRGCFAAFEVVLKSIVA